MLKAQHSRLAQRFFGWYFRMIFNRHFAGFIGELPSSQVDRAVCWISNHSSWWDGVWPLMLNAKHEKRPFYVMMLEKELIKRRFLRGLGAFSIAPGQRTMVESGQYLANLLQVPQNLVLIYPQGQLESMLETHIQFAAGVLRYACNTNEQVQWLFSAFFVDYGSNMKPNVYHYHHLHQFENRPTPGQINTIYQEFYDAQKLLHINMMHMQHKRI